MDQKQRLAKAAAITFGVLLVACIVIFLVMIVTRAPFKSAKTEPMDEVVVSDALVDLGTLDIPIPENGRVVALDATRYEIVALVDSQSGQQGIVIDRRSGQVLARIRFNQSKP